MTTLIDGETAVQYRKVLSKWEERMTDFYGHNWRERMINERLAEAKNSSHRSSVVSQATSGGG